MKTITVSIVLSLAVVLNGLNLVHDEVADVTRLVETKSPIRGNLDGTPYYWKYHGEGKLVRITAKAGLHINQLQFHFSDGSSSPFIGGTGGYPYDIQSI